MDHVQFKNSSNFFTSMCCHREEEEQSLIDEDQAPKCQTLLNIVQHPLSLFLAASTFGACATQLVTPWIMGQPGCDLSALYTGAALIVPLVLGGIGGVGAIAGVTQCLSDNRLINTRRKNEGGSIEEVSKSDESESATSEIDDEDEIVSTGGRNAAPRVQSLRNACKHPGVMVVEAAIVGALFEFLLLPTILDPFNCDLSHIQSGTGVMISAVIGLVICAVLYGVGVKLRVSDGKESISDDEHELSEIKKQDETDKVFFADEEGRKNWNLVPTDILLWLADQTFDFSDETQLSL